jgi:hypothetical protein
MTGQYSLTKDEIEIIEKILLNHDINGDWLDERFNDGELREISIKRHSKIKDEWYIEVD